MTTHLNPILPLSVPIMPYGHERAHLVRHTRIPTYSSFHWPCLDGPLQDIPVLLLQSFPCTPRDLFAQLNCIARLGITEVHASILTFK